MSENFLSSISEYSENPQQVANNPQTVVPATVKPANGETRNGETRNGETRKRWNPQRGNPQTVTKGQEMIR